MSTILTADQLKAARKALGLSVEDLGRVIGVDERTIRRWEARERAIPSPVCVLMDLLVGSADARRTLGLRGDLIRF